MKIENSKLDFLDAFYIASGNDKNGSKLDVIVDVRSDKVIFGLFGDQMYLLATVMQQNSDSGVWTYPIQKLYPLLQQFPKNTVIEFTESEIKFSAKQKYSFQKQLAVYDSIDLILAKVAEAPKKTINLVDIEKLGLTKPFQGSETNLAVTDLQNDHWVASNKQTLFLLKTNNNLPNEIVHIPKIIILLAEKLKMKSMMIKQYDEIRPGVSGWIVEDQGIIIMMADQKYLLPKVFSSSISVNIPTDSITVNKKDLITVLNRLAIVSVENADNRIFITVHNDELLLESRDYNKCEESLPIKAKSYTDDKGPVEFLIDTQSFIRGLNAVPGDDVFININSDPANRMRMIQIHNSTQEEKVLHVLLSNKKSATTVTNQPANGTSNSANPAA